MGIIRHFLAYKKRNSKIGILRQLFIKKLEVYRNEVIEIDYYTLEAHKLWKKFSCETQIFY